ncbi:transposase [Frankia sp. AgPm24]|uniref:transposase n=1 Tax=Frankia sp. AgPm24 TaxID=631128 RepID=UPI00200EFC32|nr:transposase [Frankia sp. AgPm24]MCK9923326.1 transposase [Frankia sp. AgPm24]
MRVRGAGSGRVSIAGLACYRPGQVPRWFYRLREHRGRAGEPKGFGWREYRDLVVAAHRRLGRPIVLVWDNLNIHRCAEMLAFIAANALWLTVIRLPSYSPELNPVEGVWSLLKRGEIANRVLVDVDHLTGLVRRGLRRVGHHPDLLEGCLAGTGLTLTPSHDQAADLAH